METFDSSAAGRVLLLVVAGLVLMSICYLALGHAQASAETVVDSACLERTVDGGLFDTEWIGTSALVCATEPVPSSLSRRTASRSALH